MRPINLIPPEERTKYRRTVGDGTFGWSVIAVLILALVGAYMVSTTASSVSEREAEVAHLEQQVETAEHSAEELAPYVSFIETVNARRMTVASLAASRFDWERVMRELSMVIPDDIVITSLTGTISPDVTVPGGTSVTLRADSEGPALELTGCGIARRGEAQDAVARFISALYGIDGVTRVGVPESTLNGGGEQSGCTGREVSNFQAVAVFDYAPTAGEPTAPPPVAEPDTGGNGVPAARSDGTGSGADIPDAQSQAATGASRNSTRNGG